MNAFVLHEFDERAALARWSASAAIIVAIHAALIAFGVAWYGHAPPSGVALPTIMIDLAPPSAPSAPSAQPLDIPAEPEIPEAGPPPPPPEPPQQQAAQEQFAPTPPQENPLAKAPPEQKIEPPPNPEPVKVAAGQPKPVPLRPKPVRTELKKAAHALPTARARAVPKAERQASLTSPSAAAGAASSAAALASYNQRVAAHLQRFKQYPSGARAAGEQGTSRLSFTISRSGQVLGSRLAGSSGHPALDGETLAMVRRAQPFPPMPPELKQASMSFSIPVQFSIR